jgi:peroxiredoxin
MKRIVFIIILLLATVPAHARAPRIGEVVASFALQNLIGKKVDTAQFKGRPTVIYFWNYLCGCTEQLIALKSFIIAQKSRQLAFVTVNEGQSKAIAESVITANRLPYDALLDSDLSVGRNLFGIKVLPTIFIIDRGGILREKLIGVVDNRKLESLILRYL